MARVTAPFLSLDASGKLADVLVASKWKGRNYMRLRVDPSNPQSDYQVGIRNSMFYANTYFNKGTYLTAGQKAAWNAYAEAEQMSGWNRFARFYVVMNYDKPTGSHIYTGIPTPQ